MTTDSPSPSPCRRNDRHDEHVYEVYGRPFQCPGYAPRTDAELLAELSPLAAVIANKIATVPVRIGPGGADNLISDLTIAVAVYCGKHVLPADALALANPPWPAETEWHVETRLRTGQWVHLVRLQDNALPEALQSFRELAASEPQNFRLLRATTSYAVEAEHAPEQS